MKEFNIVKMAVSLLPTVLRRPIVSAIMRAAISPLQGSHDTLMSSHAGRPYGTMYRLAHTGQVSSLESLLNDRHDNERRGIMIGGEGGGEQWWLYTENELTAQPTLRTHLGERWLGGDGDVVETVEADFVVRAPRDLEAAEAAIRASIEDMRIAGVTYAIVYY